VQLRQFRQMLEHQFGIMFVFVDAVNAVAVTIAFLFIMTTLYTVVLQRRRDIAILKSSGASNGFILRQVLAESLLLTALGTMTGVVLSLTAGALIETFRPLLTVQWSWRWIGIACLVAATGAILSGLYPAWRATRVDMIKVLAWE
jgi:putative ABC transport system permease protein